MTWLADQTWPEASTGPATLLIPLGSCEQHGPHLPVDTDTVIAVELCRRALRQVGDEAATVGPALAYGASGEHAGFSGTLSIGTAALTTVLVELGRSAIPPYGRLVFVNGHGGNVPGVDAACRLLDSEGRDVAWFAPRFPDADAHAGHTETSIMMAIEPDRVRSEFAEPGNTTSLAELMPSLQAGGVKAVSSNGVLGDPSTASAAAGHALLATAVAQLVELLLVGT